MSSEHRSHPEEPALLRLLAEELPPAEAEPLTHRLAREPELAAAWERLSRQWQGLELPPAAGAPPGFATRVTARAKAAVAGGDLRAAPVWLRATAVLALAAGLALGVGAGLWQGAESAEEIELAAPSLAESYWEAVAEDGGEAEP